MVVDRLRLENETVMFAPAAGSTLPLAMDVKGYALALC